MFTISGRTIHLDGNYSTEAPYHYQLFSPSMVSASHHGARAYDLIHPDGAVVPCAIRTDPNIMEEMSRFDTKPVERILITLGFTGKNVGVSALIDYMEQHCRFTKDNKFDDARRRRMADEIVEMIRDATGGNPYAFALGMATVFGGTGTYNLNTAPPVYKLLKGPVTAKRTWDWACRLTGKSGRTFEDLTQPSDMSLGVDLMLYGMRVKSFNDALHNSIAHTEDSGMIAYISGSPPSTGAPEYTEESLASLKKLAKRLVRWHKTTKRA